VALFYLQSARNEGAMLVHRTPTLNRTSERWTGWRASPRDLGTEAVEQRLTSGETPELELHLGLRVAALSSIWLLQVLSLLSPPSLSAPYRGFLFSQVGLGFFT